MAPKDKWQDWQRDVEKFCVDRDWDQFHNPKDLAIGLSIEAAELLEQFRYKSLDEISEAMSQPEFRQKVGDELVDVLFTLIRFSQLHGFDLDAVFKDKMKRNEKKYPVEKSRGKNLKYTEL